MSTIFAASPAAGLFQDEASNSATTWLLHIQRLWPLVLRLVERNPASSAAPSLLSSSSLLSAPVLHAPNDTAVPACSSNSPSQFATLTPSRFRQSVLAAALSPFMSPSRSSTKAPCPSTELALTSGRPPSPSTALSLPAQSSSMTVTSLLQLLLQMAEDLSSVSSSSVQRAIDSARPADKLTMLMPRVSFLITN